MKKYGIILVGISLSIILRGPGPVAAAGFCAPLDLAFAPDGRRLAVADAGGRLLVLDSATGQREREVALAGNPSAVLWLDEGQVLVAQCGAGVIAQIDAAQGKVTRTFAAAPRPAGLALARKSGLLLAANSGTNDISIFDLNKAAELVRLPVGPEPGFIAVTPDETLALVSNQLPAGSAAERAAGAFISLIDLRAKTRLADIPLGEGVTNVRQIRVSADGKWAYTVHNIGRSFLPTTQLDRGWVTTNALSILSLEQRKVYATLLLDTLTRGAADPWGIALGPGGQDIWISLAGVHELAHLKLRAVHERLEGKTPADSRPNPGGTWELISRDPVRQRPALANDLVALSAAGLLQRSPLPGKTPRGLALSPDGQSLAVAGYYSGSIVMIEPATGKVRANYVLDQRPPDEARRGEMIFNDATYCYQGWLSCATCHPDGRADGLNWDLPNDGIGNPKNTRSLLLSWKTPPVMSHGVRADMETAAAAGFKYILFRQPQAAELEAVQAYLRAMAPARSPWLDAQGQLTPKARRGQALFESDRTGCAACHAGPLFTNLKLADVGTGLPQDSSDAFDTPTLIELWRTGPYLHYGQAATLGEVVLTRFNPQERHGSTAGLGPDEIDALVEYLRSL